MQTESNWDSCGEIAAKGSARQALRFIPPGLSTVRPCYCFQAIDSCASGPGLAVQSLHAPVSKSFPDSTLQAKFNLETILRQHVSVNPLKRSNLSTEYGGYPGSSIRSLGKNPNPGVA